MRPEILRRWNEGEAMKIIRTRRKRKKKTHRIKIVAMCMHLKQHKILANIKTKCHFDLNISHFSFQHLNLNYFYRMKLADRFT